MEDHVAVHECGTKFTETVKTDQHLNTVELRTPGHCGRVGVRVFEDEDSVSS